MNVIETFSEGLTRTFKIVVPAAEVDQQINRKLGELAGTVRLPGFRPGKVPLELVRKRYGQSVMGEVLDEAVRQSSATAVTDKGLKTAGSPKIEVKAFDQGKDLEYELTIDLMPEIVPADFSTISLERLKAEVTDKDVADDLMRLARRMRETQPVDPPRAAAKGDLVVVDFEGKIDGKVFEGGSGTDVPLELGSETFIPGFEDQLVGAEAGDSREVKVTFPADYVFTDVAGKPAVFTVTAKEIRSGAPAAVDEALAKKVGLESLDALRKTGRERLERQHTQISRAKLKRKLLDALAEKHSFPAPKNMVDSEFSNILKQVSQSNGGKEPSETERTEFRPIAERRVRLGLLLSEIGRRNNIQVGEEELRRALASEASRYPGREREVIDFYQKNPEALIQLRAPIYEDKIIDFILEMAKVTDRTVSAAELIRDEGLPAD
ncbi:MAG: trigger factor [Alphaproteobacteria bacterium]|nr:trigger factor [Alphaproteobacteria bacterium]